MGACPVCAAENPAGSQFCNRCGSPLDVPDLPETEERKVVTALFCDLVGFTALSEMADPEDVNQMLGAYFAVARGEVQAHGGVVEKFIGDAVVGVFGVPAAHEDDPERAVRAGLRIAELAAALQSLDGSPLRLRIGVNTGEVLVRVRIEPGSGEGFLAGDAINTASRIQSVAPEGGVAVGLGTHEATRDVIDYVELAPATLKGKAEPVRIFQPTAARAAPGTDLARSRGGRFVGRSAELRELRRLFEHCVDEHATRLVTIVGQPGLGKSRLVAEVRAAIEDQTNRVTWLQGRCLPYGAGVTFWALGEIVKARAGILESDAPDVASVKLDGVLPAGDERPWLRERLLPLLGLASTSIAEPGELFAAWRGFIEQLGEGSPTVLVFEDLHWAGEGMLSFLEYLVEHARRSAILVIGTARPELFEHHPAFASARVEATRIVLSPLVASDARELAAALLDDVTIPGELARTLVDQAGGNPLFLGEFVRLLRERDLLVERPDGWALRDGGDVPFPSSVQALIAARIDLLAPGTKSVLADAAVVGGTFWAGAIAAMRGQPARAVLDTLEELTTKDFVRPSPSSSVSGEAEYSFAHILVRDVAYGELPRAARARRHVAAARWIEATAAGRTEDVADVLAYHYATALDLSRATGQMEQAAGLEDDARRFLALAGDRALNLDLPAAMSFFERALSLVPAGHPERAAMLVRFGVAGERSGRFRDAVEALDEAVELYRETGDVLGEARAMNGLVLPLLRLGDPRGWTLSTRSLALLEPLGPSRDLVGALTETAVDDAIQGRYEVAIESAERAMGMARDLGLEVYPRTLGFRGLARTGLGDAGGLTDMREAITLARTAGHARDVGAISNNLAAALWAYEGPAPAVAEMRDGMAYVAERGLADMAFSIECGMLDALVDLGELDRVLQFATDTAPGLEAKGEVFNLMTVRAAQARTLAIRGTATDAKPWLDAFEASARQLGSADFMAALASAVVIRLLLGQEQPADELLSEIEGTKLLDTTPNYFLYLPAMIRACVTHGRVEVVERLLARPEPAYPCGTPAFATSRAALAEVRGDLDAASAAYRKAAASWASFGNVPEEGFALFGLGRTGLAGARPDEGRLELSAARSIFERLNGQPALADIEGLLASGPA